MSHLPGILGTIATVAGEAAALKLARELGGTTIKLSADPAGKLATVVGVEAAEAMVKEWSQGYFLTIPMAHLRGAGARRAQVARMIESKVPTAKAALACDVHDRTAKRIKARLKELAEDPDQLPMFKD